jgi:hypothetical protein
MGTPYPWTLYSPAVLEIGNGAFDLSVDAYFLFLATTSYVPAPNSDSVYANVSAFEVPAGGGYTTGGIKLAGTSWATLNGIATFLFAPATWPALSFTAAFRYGVISRAANGVSLQPTDLLLAFSDLGGGATIAGTGAQLAVSAGPGGVFAASHSP